MLKAAINSAPSSICAEINPTATKEALLAEVLRLRQQEALTLQATATTPEQGLRKIITMKTEDLLRIASSNPAQLRTEMKAAAQADPSIHQEQLDLDQASMNDLVLTVLKWQVKAHKAAKAVAEVPPPSAGAGPSKMPPTYSRGNNQHQITLTQGETPLPTLAHLLTAGEGPSNPVMSPPLPADTAGRYNPQDTSDEDEPPRTKKKAKHLIDPQGFTIGTAPTIKNILKHYRKGILSNSLNVPELKGPEILAQIIGTGSNIPTFLSQFHHWKKTSSGNPMQAEIEAHTLGRMIHTELMRHDTPLEALKKRPSLEIGLRRLYAILFVEEAVNTGAARDRGVAWKHIQFIQESLPQGTVMSEPITEEMTRLLSLQKKRIAVVKAMEDTRARKNRSNYQDKDGDNTKFPPNRRQGNRHQDTISQAANSAIHSLNIIYLVPYHPNLRDDDQHCHAAAIRACSNLYNCVYNLHLASDQEGTTSTQPWPELLVDLPSFELCQVLSDHFTNPAQAFQRGAFKRIVASEIDLPTDRPPVNPLLAKLWIKRLPDYLQHAFNAGHDAYFVTPLSKFTQLNRRQGSLPKPRIHASPQDYAKLLGKLETAGMLHWSNVLDEDQRYKDIADAIEMTLFAVSKSKRRARLISWPRVQNEALPEPPHTSLPDPSLFEAFAIKGSSPSAFYLDVSNMFHNITLPEWLTKLFPMKPIPIGNLSPTTIRRIKSRIDLSRLSPNTLVRPCQATIPMGFKWSVYIAQTFTSAALQRAFDIFKSSRFAPLHLETVQLFRKDQAPFLVAKETPILMHIIDDMVCITEGWPDEAVRAWYRIPRNVLGQDNLPTREEKSAPKHHVEKKNVDFIGCEINFQTSQIYPKPRKLRTIILQVIAMLLAKRATRREWQRVLGKLIWVATLNRPLLVCMHDVFRTVQHLQPDETFNIPESAKREIWILASLLPTAQVSMQLPLVRTLIAIDASESAGALVYTVISPQLAAQIWEQSQRARFDRSTVVNTYLLAVNHAVERQSWKLAFAHKWTKEEHIIGLEAAIAVLALEWAVRKGISSSRLLILSDSIVSIGALQKGRSSSPSPAILARCRRFGALTVAHGIRPTLAYVKSSSNPADCYTRVNSKG